MIWIGTAVAAAGVVSWLWTMASFVSEGWGFDMTSASAFDLKWTKGAVLVAVGVGVMSSSWAVGVGTGVVAFFSSMLVKPPLQRAVERRRARPIGDEEAGAK